MRDRLTDGWERNVGGGGDGSEGMKGREGR